MSDAAARVDSPEPPPDLAIRTHPPSPRRLNRRVLLGGALLLGAVVVFAALSGLSEPAGIGETSDCFRSRIMLLPISIFSVASGFGRRTRRSSSSLSTVPVTCFPSVSVTVTLRYFSSMTFEGFRI